MTIHLPHLAAAATAAALLVSACGSSSTTNTAIQPAPSAAQGTVTIPAAITTPKTGPLSKQPTIAATKGPAPKKLVVKDLIKGTGAVVKTGQLVTVNYVGASYSTGKVFDSSWSRQATAQFQLTSGSLIPGVLQGVPGMHIDGRREIIVPASLAYGKTGTPDGKVGPNEPIVFIVDALGV